MKLSIEKVFPFVSQQTIQNLAEGTKECNALLESKQGKGHDFLGWVHLPSSITASHIADINETAAKLRAKCEIVVVIGIGGSYLGAKAVIDALSNSFDYLKTNRKNPVVLYAGQNIGEDYLAELTSYLKGKQFGLINISKSGTTTEPAIAFRILKKMLEEQIGKDASKERIVAVTDSSKGALRTLADQEGYKTFIIPDDVGGRFSVLTPV
ncbi:MAG: glucose-6-phosphate isomerase, partial [Bacteroidales bacterium]